MKSERYEKETKEHCEFPSETQAMGQASYSAAFRILDKSLKMAF